MCVIAVAAQRRAKVSELRAMADANPHGIGAAILHRDVVKYVKGMTFDQVVKLSKTAPLPHVLHFRYATVGAADDPRLCHPFPTRRHNADHLEGVADAVVFHNGTWGNWQHGLSVVEQDHGGCGEGPVSDSRVIARLVSKFGPAATASVVGGKLVVFKAEAPHVVVAGGGFVDVKGLRVSNTRWILPPREVRIMGADLEERPLFASTSPTNTTFTRALNASLPIRSDVSERASSWLISTTMRNGRDVVTRVGRHDVESTLLGIADQLLDGSVTDVRVRESVV